MKIQILQIKIHDGRRKVSSEVVHELADSISKVGLLNPITVDQDYALIAGLHRLEAAKLLGWQEIECNVSSLEGLMAELAEIDENLIRHGLDYIDEGKQLARRKEIYEQLHPETRQGQRNGQTSKTASGAVLETKPFAEDVAEKLGIAPRTVRTKIQVAKNLTPKASEIVKRNDIGMKSALKLSRLPPEQQEVAANQLATGAIQSIDDYHPAAAEPAAMEDLPLGDERPSPPSETPTPPVSPVSNREEGYYPTIKDSVADMKNLDKDRSCTSDSFLAEITEFVKKFDQEIEWFKIPYYAAVFPRLSQAQLDDFQQQMDAIHTAVDLLRDQVMKGQV